MTITWNKKVTEGNNYYYPFCVSDRDAEGKSEYAQTQHIMHGFALVSDIDICENIFAWDDNGLPKESKVYEVRVKNNCGEWQEWQAILGNIRIVPFVEWQLGQDMGLLFDGLQEKFNEHFEVRYCGILFRAGDGFVQVINDDDEIIRTINPRTLRIEYYSQIHNMCYPLEEQIGDMVRFRKLYYGDRMDM